MFEDFGVFLMFTSQFFDDGFDPPTHGKSPISVTAPKAKREHALPSSPDPPTEPSGANPRGITDSENIEHRNEVSKHSPSWPTWCATDSFISAMIIF